MHISLTGAAGAATGFARTLPMKGRARQRSWIARVRRGKSDSPRPEGGFAPIRGCFCLMLPRPTTSFPNWIHTITRKSYVSMDVNSVNLNRALRRHDRPFRSKNQHPRKPFRHKPALRQDFTSHRRQSILLLDQLHREKPDLPEIRR